MELRRAAEQPAQTTLRAQLKRLTEIGAVERRRRAGFPGAVEFELTELGLELSDVASTLERWLERAPASSISLSEGGAEAAIKALAEGWSTTIMRSLAARP